MPGRPPSSATVRLDGLPVLGQIERELVTFVARADGGTSGSGWPRDWRNLTLEARSGAAQGKIEVANDPAGQVEGDARLARPIPA